MKILTLHLNRFGTWKVILKICQCSVPLNWLTIYSLHCVKSVQMRKFSWSVFSCIRTEYWDLLCKSPYSVQRQENMDHKNSIFRHFSRSDRIAKNLLFKNFFPRIFQSKCSCISHLHFTIQYVVENFIKGFPFKELGPVVPWELISHNSNIGITFSKT